MHKIEPTEPTTHKPRKIPAVIHSVTPHPMLKSNQQLMFLSQIHQINFTMIVSPLEEQCSQILDQYKIMDDKVRNFSQKCKRKVNIIKQLGRKVAQQSREANPKDYNRQIVTEPKHHNKKQKIEEQEISSLQKESSSREQEDPSRNQYRYQCRCKKQFGTNSAEQYKQHITVIHHHKVLPYYSHFMTELGNLIPYEPDLILFPIKFFPKHSLKFNEETLIRNQKHTSKKKYPKKRSAKQSSLTPIKKLTNINSKSQITKKKQYKAKEIFFCGKCNRNLKNYKGYKTHLRCHDTIIGPTFSHIIIKHDRKKMTPMLIQPLPEENPNKQFVCVCQPDRKFIRKQFIEHVLKWHGGITPTPR